MKKIALLGAMLALAVFFPDAVFAEHGGHEDEAVTHELAQEELILVNTVVTTVDNVLEGVVEMQDEMIAKKVAAPSGQVVVGESSPSNITPSTDALIDQVMLS